MTSEPRLIDCYCNGGVYNLGHRHPEVMRALLDSVQELNLGSHHLISEQRAALAAKLAELGPGDISYAVFSVECHFWNRLPVRGLASNHGHARPRQFYASTTAVVRMLESNGIKAAFHSSRLYSLNAPYARRGCQKLGS